MNLIKRRIRKMLNSIKTEKTILLALCAIFAFLTIFTRSFFTAQNLITVLVQVSVIGIVALGMTLIIISGNIDLSVGSSMAIAGVAAAIFIRDFNIPVFIAILIAISLSVLVGLMNGFITAKGKIPAFIVTLGSVSALRGVAMIMANGIPIGGLPQNFNFIGGGKVFGVPMPIIIYFVIIVITHLILTRTLMGRYAYALGGNETATKLSGIKIDSLKIKIYLFAGLLTGIGGIVLASRIRSGQPNVGIGYELDAIAACIIGGVSFNGGIGSVFGTVIGTLIMGIINNGLDLLNVQSYYQAIVKGAIVVAAVLIDRKRLT